ncbi:MAG: hypothetical protein L0099_07440 [Acidobacteria bacterium]|nr:hypothetical protein [Acidobacteriota bacterium]
MAESWGSRLWQWRLNLFLLRTASGVRVTYLADDWRELRLKRVLNWRTDNYVGTNLVIGLFGNWVIEKRSQIAPLPNYPITKCYIRRKSEGEGSTRDAQNHPL